MQEIADELREVQDRITDEELRPEGARLVELVAFAAAMEVAP